MASSYRKEQFVVQIFAQGLSYVWGRGWYWTNNPVIGRPLARPLMPQHAKPFWAKHKTGYCSLGSYHLSIKAIRMLLAVRTVRIEGMMDEAKSRDIPKDKMDLQVQQLKKNNDALFHMKTQCQHVPEWPRLNPRFSQQRLEDTYIHCIYTHTILYFQFFFFSRCHQRLIMGCVQTLFSFFATEGAGQ